MEMGNSGKASKLSAGGNEESPKLAVKMLNGINVIVESQSG